jgi:hypothetical protein
LLAGILLAGAWLLSANPSVWPFISPTSTLIYRLPTITHTATSPSPTATTTPPDFHPSHPTET